jgi:hypothetical protein
MEATEFHLGVGEPRCTVRFTCPCRDRPILGIGVEEYSQHVKSVAVTLTGGDFVTQMVDTR